MDLTEIKELYAEELKLLKRILNYGKEQRQGELERVDKERAYEELELRTIEYANSLLERREVYRDQVKSTGVEWDDGLIDNFWELTMEDNFLDGGREGTGREGTGDRREEGTGDRHLSQS